MARQKLANYTCSEKIATNHYTKKGKLANMSTISHNQFKKSLL